MNANIQNHRKKYYKTYTKTGKKTKKPKTGKKTKKPKTGKKSKKSKTGKKP